MYKGTNPSALTSQRRIAEAMRELMTAKPFDAISVAALCRLAGVSRQTFYSLFRSRENVALYMLISDTRNEPVTSNDLEGILHALCRNYSRFVVNKEPVLRLLAENGKASVLLQLFCDTIRSSEYFRDYVRPELQPYVAGYVGAGLTSITLTYLNSDTDPDMLETVAYTLIKGELFK